MPAPPRILAHFDERPRLVVRSDGSLLGLYLAPDAEGTGWQLTGRTSADGGATWSRPETLLGLPRDPGHWGGPQVLATTDGEVHAFLLNDAGTGVFALPGQSRRPLPLAERHLDVWHARTDGGGQSWRQPVRIWEGYTGSINAAIQTRTGRLVLPFARQTARTWGDRGQGLDAFWFAGTSETVVLTSDDGETWRLSEAVLKCQTPSIGIYGAVEPVVVERAADAEGPPLWMLARTQLGRFYQSFSEDGKAWSPLAPSALLSSDSPAGLVRLADGRLVLLWNKCLRFPYAHGGRHVLHGAVSFDHGVTWVGHREVARDPQRYAPPPSHGDHGTAYPFPVVLPDDTVLVTTGQGAGRVVIVAVDPEWLCQPGQRASLDLPSRPAVATTNAAAAVAAAGAIDGTQVPEEWAAFGCRGVRLRQGVAGAGGPALEVARTDPAWPAGAVWNHPLGRAGRLGLRLHLSPGSAGARLLLTDHFSVPFDPEDALASMFALCLAPAPPPSSDAGATAAASVQDRDGPSGPLAAVPGPVEGAARVAVPEERWVAVEVTWDCDAGAATARVDGGEPVRLPLRRRGDGVCYLRLRPVAEAVGPGFLVTAVAVEVDLPASGRARGATPAATRS